MKKKSNETYQKQLNCTKIIALKCASFYEEEEEEKKP